MTEKDSYSLDDNYVMAYGLTLFALIVEMISGYGRWITNIFWSVWIKLIY